MLDLITPAQALALLPGLPALDPAAVPALCTAASRVVERYCKRSLAFGGHLEYHRPDSTRTIRLKHPPVIPGSVELRVDLAAVASLACSDPAARRATARNTATELSLVRYRAAGPLAQAYSLGSYPTLAGLAAAVVAGGGWTCSVGPGYSGWLVADLEPNPGAMSGLGAAAGLVAYTRGLDAWAMDAPEQGVLEIAEDRPQAYRFADRTGSGFGPGTGSWAGTDARVANVRCSYQAGFDPAGVAAPTAPEDLVEAVALTIRALLDSGRFSGVYTSITLGNTSVTAGAPVILPAAVRLLLSPYRLRRF